jgi:branched-chain amino acid transport system substrate-binding protein
MRRRSNLAAVLSACMIGLGALGLAACGGEDEAGVSGDSDAPLRVGLAQPLTGPVAAAGIAVRNGAEIAVKQINAKGGVDGRKLSLVVEDDANDPATCTNVAQKLATQDRVPVIIGFWGSSCTLPAIPVLERSGIPLVVETSGADAITDPKGSWNDSVFRLAPTGGQEAAAIGKVLRQELGSRSIFQLAVNNDFGRSFADAYSGVMKDLGIKDAGRAFFDQADQDFSNQVTKSKRSGADTIITITDVGQIAVILKEMRAQGVDAKVLTSGGSNNPEEVIRLAGARAAEDHYAAVYFPFFDPALSESPTEAKAFMKTWRAEGHERGELPEAARGYDAVHVVADALGRASDPTSAEAIKEALGSTSGKGIIFGDMKFQDWNALKQQNSPPVFLVRATDGKVELVAESKPPY